MEPSLSDFVAMIVINFVVVYPFFAIRSWRRIGYLVAFATGALTTTFFLKLYTLPIGGFVVMALLGGWLSFQAYFWLCVQFGRDSL